MNDDPSQRAYVVTLTDVFEIERDAAFLYVGGIINPEYAADWDAGLKRLILALPEFPGPRANAMDEEAIALYGREVRRTLYYGPYKRKSRTPYRVLYTIIEPEDSREGYIRILRLVHGSRPLILPEG